MILGLASYPVIIAADDATVFRVVARSALDAIRAVRATVEDGYSGDFRLLCRESWRIEIPPEGAAPDVWRGP